MITRALDVSICMGIVLAVCNTAMATESERRPPSPLIESTLTAAKGIGKEARTVAEDAYGLLKGEVAYVHDSVREAPNRIGPATKRAVPDLVDALKGEVSFLRKTLADAFLGPEPKVEERARDFIQSPDEGIESVADWLLEPVDSFVLDGLF